MPLMGTFKLSLGFTLSAHLFVLSNCFCILRKSWFTFFSVWSWDSVCSSHSSQTCRSHQVLLRCISEVSQKCLSALLCGEYGAWPIFDRSRSSMEQIKPGERRHRNSIGNLKFKTKHSEHPTDGWAHPNRRGNLAICNTMSKEIKNVTKSTRSNWNGQVEIFSCKMEYRWFEGYYTASMSRDGSLGF